MLHILNSKNTILNKFIGELRDKRVQTDSMRFRRNLERIAEISAYEISKELNYRSRIVETPLGEASVESIDDTIVIATILRAGLPFHQGFLNYFDDAQNAFVSAYRKSKADGSFTVKVEYISCGSLEGKTLLLVDPMLATGSSLILAYEALIQRGGEPAHTHFRLRHSQRTGCRLRSSTHLRAEVHPLVRRRRRGVDLALLYRPRPGRCGGSCIWRKALIFFSVKNGILLPRTRLAEREIPLVCPVRLDIACVA